MARVIAPNVVALDDERIATRNFAPGQRVYDEDLLTIDGQEFRSWNPQRSKLGSYLVKGGRNFPLREDSRVLYLGAANGTTPSHVSDIVREGVLVAVEFSPRSFRDLMTMSGPRPNIVPVLADAWRPELYERYLGKVDLVFQDIAQRQQAQIFAKNINRFQPPWAILAVKARSVDVAANPRDVYEQVAKDLETLTNYEVIESVDLGPFEKDHAALVLRPRTGAPRERREERQTERRDERPRNFERPPPRDTRPPPRGGDGPRRFGPKNDRPGGYGGGGGQGGGGQRPWDKPRGERPSGGDRPQSDRPRRDWR